MNKIIRKFGVSVLSVLLISSFASCNNNTGSNTEESSNTLENSSSTDNMGVDLVQFSELQDNEVIAVVTVKNYGEIRIRFFPDEAPKAVENFITHAKEGYYDGILFHRVIPNFMIQSGDPLGNGTGGESIWGEPFEMEISNNLYHFKGALAMARTSAPVSQGSQFYMVQGEPLSKLQNDSYWSKFTSLPDEVIEKYKEVGGYPSLDTNYTVFGQVYEGLDVIEKISSVAADANDKPMEDVVIETIKIENYSNQ